MSQPLHTLTAAQACARIAAGTLGVEELARACLDHIAARDPVIRAWSYLDPAQVLREARELDKSPRRSALHGIPIGVKDVFDTRDMPTQHNSPQYRGHRPGQDAGCVATLRAAGALILGKTDTTEFAAAGRWAATGNPRDPARSAGGSSSGSAAAVADGQVPLALGTQTGGSLIRPASFCGAYALKPTWGMVSREGAKLYAATLDTVGWYGREVADLRLLAELFELGAPAPEPAPPLSAMRLAICQTSVWHEAGPASRAALAQAAARLSDAGASVTELVLPAAFDKLPTDLHKAVLHGEGRAAFLNLRHQFGAALHDDFRGRAENRAGITAAQLCEAWDTAAACRPAFDALARAFDGILTPSAPGVAPIGRSPGNPVFNQMWTLLHVPCINLPGYLADDALPVGVTLVGPRCGDLALLAVAEIIAPVLAAA
jgi:Asp-tRNA(Asn)/Glu-tRNA(Gln) amidotransferase A subunit family amidase